MFINPPEGYAEIAVVDVPVQIASTDLSGLKEDIRSYVCQAGGDAAVAHANGYGQYIKATVLKRSQDATFGAERPGPADSAPDEFAGSKPKNDGSGFVTGKAPVDDGRCHYDTQCKGERICVQGDCVDPAPKAAPPAAAAQ
jgi:hypothetical protein